MESENHLSKVWQLVKFYTTSWEGRISETDEEVYVSCIDTIKLSNPDNDLNQNLIATDLFAPLDNHGGNPPPTFITQLPLFVNPSIVCLLETYIHYLSYC